ncbi:unnamed protein product [Peronospora destructor]|uniref:Polyprotein n=1 Tax=Peronospora destructor TaxID=86335 RepID=A0AAV0V8B3_9STRA|nr:unnamed protein product [Peronospora destructor]
MIEHAGLSKRYWGEAVMTAAFLRNRCPTRATGNGKSPHEAWTQKKPLLKNLKVFGYHAYVHIPREKRSKLDPREDSGDCSNQDEDEDIEELPATLAPTRKRPSVPRSTNERPQWQQQQTPRQQPQQLQQPNVEYPPGSKHHSRTHSLRTSVSATVEKRYGRVGRTSGASSTPAQGSRSSLDDMLALLASIEEEECAHVVY